MEYEILHYSLNCLPILIIMIFIETSELQLFLDLEYMGVAFKITRDPVKLF